MSQTYNSAVSEHYASYRPPLHAMILHKLLGTNQFGTGLDVGCGTGQSSVPLTSYCDRVIAVDPSEEMLANAQSHPKVEYRLGDAESLSLPDTSVDLIAFAGSLFYTKTERLMVELRRVAMAKAMVVVYDFELLLYDHLRVLSLEVVEDSTFYDHAVSFAGEGAFDELIRKKEKVTLQLSNTELAHMVLSTSERYEALQRLLGVEDPFERVTERLSQKTRNAHLEAGVYYSAYRFIQ